MSSGESEFLEQQVQMIKSMGFDHLEDDAIAVALLQHDNSVDAALDALLAAKAEEEARSGPADYEPEHLPSERSNRS
eukprot:CAMPEP_0177724704 /NCGR_PEP_ID=MMETSP0484_2-20121128/18867_1 /TAXON_ID=354590 /ORGANISM="Rhodomonas lens, Strain RHODO" /LENGTH=76 /DNA_ID=CAMNT_0019237183 /DNA_START=61 /DNA_END=291 /DNA_ORIENTATION=+